MRDTYDMTHTFMRGSIFDTTRQSVKWIDANVDSGDRLVGFSSFDRRNRITPSRICEREKEKDNEMRMERESYHGIYPRWSRTRSSDMGKQEMCLKTRKY